MRGVIASIRRMIGRRNALSQELGARLDISASARSELMLERLELFTAIGKALGCRTPTNKKEAVEILNHHQELFSLMLEALAELSPSFKAHTNAVGSSTILAYLYEVTARCAEEEMSIQRMKTHLEVEREKRKLYEAEGAFTTLHLKQLLSRPSRALS